MSYLKNFKDLHYPLKLRLFFGEDFVFWICPCSAGARWSAPGCLRSVQEILEEGEVAHGSGSFHSEEAPAFPHLKGSRGAASHDIACLR